MTVLRCNTLRHTASRQYVAVTASLQYVAVTSRQYVAVTAGSMLQWLATYLQHTANTFQDRSVKQVGLSYMTATHCNTLQHTATHYKSRQHIATHCNAHLWSRSVRVLIWGYLCILSDFTKKVCIYMRIYRLFTHTPQLRMSWYKHIFYVYIYTYKHTPFHTKKNLPIRIFYTFIQIRIMSSRFLEQ